MLGVVAAAEIYSYGDISKNRYKETLSAPAIVKELNKIDATVITVHLNSIAGSVPEDL